MAKSPSITDAEWDVMKVLWEREGQWLVALEIVTPVARGRGVHHRTVRTLLARLVKKGAVEMRMGEGIGVYQYRARVARDAVVRAESRWFLSRVFDGEAAPALVHILRESRDRFSEEEMEELRALLKAKEKQ